MIHGDNSIVRLEDLSEKSFSFRLFLPRSSPSNLYLDDLISMWKTMRDLMATKAFFVTCNLHITAAKATGA